MARKGIYRRVDKWSIRYAGLNGKIIRKSSHTDKYTEAELLLHMDKKAVEEGKQPVTKGITNYNFYKLTDKYLAWIKGRHKTADTKAYRINKMASHFGDIPIRHFNTMIVEQYQTDLRNRGLKPTSINKNISRLSVTLILPLHTRETPSMCLTPS